MLQNNVISNLYFEDCWSFVIVWFQKISILPPQRELEIPEGRGGSKTQEIPKGRGAGQSI